MKDITTNTKVLNQNEKDCIETLYKKFLKSQYIPTGSYIFFDILRASKVINPSGSELRKSYSISEKILSESNENKNKSVSKFHITSRAKCNYLQEFFLKIKQSNKDITEILNK